MNAEKKMTNAKGVAKYIGRYLARPAIAEYRIESYDGSSVHFWYEDHRTGKRIDKTWPIFKFIFECLQHIPPKHFRMVGRQILSLYAFVRKRQLTLILENKKKKKTYRERMIEAFEKDPFKCPYCHSEMELTEIWYADYGYLFHYIEDAKIIRPRYRRDENGIKRRTG